MSPGGVGSGTGSSILIQPRLGHVVMPRLVNHGYLDLSPGNEARKASDKIR